MPNFLNKLSSILSKFSSGGKKKACLSRGWFRSIDLWVMGPARSRCATLLTDGLTRLLFLYYEYHEQRPISLYR